MAKRDEIFKGGMATLGLTFNREPGPVLDAYWLVLGDLSDVELSRSFARALTQCKFFPVPAELLAFAGRAPRDLAAEATLAWDAVRRAMDSLDVYGNPDFGQVVNAVVRNLGGWAYLCEQKLSELEWRRKDFERVYRLWAEKDPSVIPEGGPLFGYWKNAKVTRIEIAGLPVQSIALPPIETPQAQVMREVVRELADSKGLGGDRPGPAPLMGHASDPTEKYEARESGTEGAATTAEAAAKTAGETALPPRRERVAVRISEDEKAAAIARMTEQLAARSVTT